MKLSILINLLNYLQLRRLQRRCSSPSGYSPFLLYVHLSCVTFSLCLTRKEDIDEAELLSEEPRAALLKLVANIPPL
jgi:hypothetical protein